MLIIGLTGNIGCGKTTMSNYFIENNIPVIDADKVSREILNNTSALKEIFEYFGDKMKLDDGSLDRKKLGSVVFSDDNELMKLNSITHPKIKNDILNKIEYYKSKNKNIVVIDAALLIEAKWIEVVEKLVLVTCKKEIQIDRVISRDNISRVEALNRIDSQMSQEYKIKYADYIIDNSATKEEFISKADELLIYIKENWCE